MATPDEIAAAAAAAAGDGVQSASADGQSASAMDPLKQLDTADRLAGRQALAGANAAGGPKSGWGRVRMARGVTKGPMPQ